MRTSRIDPADRIRQQDAEERRRPTLSARGPSAGRLLRASGPSASQRRMRQCRLPTLWAVTLAHAGAHPKIRNKQDEAKMGPRVREGDGNESARVAFVPEDPSAFSVNRCPQHPANSLSFVDSRDGDNSDEHQSTESTVLRCAAASPREKSLHL
jgi:hypothetical protein